MKHSQTIIQRLPLILLALLLPLSTLAASTRQGPPIQTGTWTHGTSDDWQPGTFNNTIADGTVLRLQDGQTSGDYISAPLQAPFGFNAAVIQWNAQINSDQTLTIEARSSVDGQSWSEWQTAQPMGRAQGAAVSQVLVFPPFTSWLQYRVVFAGSNGSPTLDQIKLSYISSTAGPNLADVVGRVPLVGPATLTLAPEAVARGEWAGATPAAPGERQQPRRVELAQIVAPVDDPNPLATLRALRWVHQQIFGQPELPYHYLIDGQGNLYEGLGSATQRIPGVESGTVRIAVLANAEVEGISEAAQARLIDVMAWLIASYDIAPDQIVGADVAPQQLKETVQQLRATADQAVVRSRTIFAEGTTEGATERLALFNPTTAEARATLSAFTSNGEERRTVVVPPGQRVDVTLNSTIPESGPVALDVQADRHVLAERALIDGRELLGSTGASEPARAWYFAEGTTISDTETYVQVLNPQRQEVAATLTFYPDGTTPVTHTTTVAPRSRSTLRLSDLLPNAQFALKLVASQPVVAERSVYLATGAAHLATGISELSRHWSFAEGSTTDGYTTTLHLLNPWPQQVATSIQVMSEDGTSLTRRYALPPQSRFVLTLNDVVPALPFAMEVQTERPVAAERVLRFDHGAGATATAGARAPATRWTFVEGSTAQPAEEFLLVSNPGTETVDLDVMYVLADGKREHRQHSVPPMARLTISANADVPDQPIVTAILTGNYPIVAERSIFVTSPEGRGAETGLGISGR